MDRERRGIRYGRVTVWIALEKRREMGEKYGAFCAEMDGAVLRYRRDKPIRIVYFEIRFSD